MFKINVNNSSYTEWSIEPPNININPLNSKLFDEDIVDKNINIIESPNRHQNLLGILVLNNFQTFGKIKEKSLYKIIPRNNKLPHFLVPYEIKKSDMGFSKNIQNKYIIFKFINWDNKHPLGQIVDTIGPINDLPSFYKYELQYKNLNISLTKFNKEVQKIKLIDFNDIIMKYGQINNTNNFKGLPENHNIENRESWKVFSIDPDNSLDFDDAFSIKIINNNTLISIYISNVPIIIDYLNLWESFSERVATIYLPDSKLPILPLILSDNICSLKENETRIAFCMDVLVNNEGNIINTSFKNVSVKLKYNFRYESSKLLSYTNYKNLYNIVKKMYPSINDSHDLVAQLMILMNHKCGLYLQNNNTGIYRATIENNNFMDDKLRQTLLLNNYSGIYTNDFNQTNHNVLDLKVYSHITSPIRRIVDIMNMIQFIKSGLSDKAIKFYNLWNTKLDYINNTNKSIKKLQSICNLIHLFSNDNEILNKTFDGYYIDNNETIYIPELKLITKTKTKIKTKLEIYNKHKFKFYLFLNEDSFYKKIKVDLIL